MPARLLAALATAAGLLGACSTTASLAPYVSVCSADALCAPGDADLILAVSPTGELEAYTLRETPTRANPAEATYRIITRVSGPYPRPPRAAVSAVWRVRDPQMRRDFERSREELFLIRKRHLSGFHSDLLLEDVAQPGRYLIIGLYGREKDLSLARGHPEVVEFSQRNPAARFGATEERPLIRYDVIRAALRWTFLHSAPPNGR